MIPDKREQLLALAVHSGAVHFGSYTLKSGRKSPYFFNLAALYHGQGLSLLAELMVERLLQFAVQPDCLFGLAYKGIPLASILANHYFLRTGISLPVVCDRKEIKPHGEGGQLIGGPFIGNILLIDDVLTAGTALKHGIHILQQHHINPNQIAAAMVIFDRQESSALTNPVLEQLSVHPLLRLDDLISYLIKWHPKHESLAILQQYRETIGKHHAIQ